MATATDRNAKLDNPGSDAPEIVAFFEELQTLMTGVGDEYEEGTKKHPRQWEISSTASIVVHGMGAFKKYLSQMDNRLKALEGSQNVNP